MEVFQSKEDLGSIELGLPQGELLSLDVQHQVTTAHVLHDEINSGFRLEARM